MDAYPNVCEATSQSNDFNCYRPTHRKGKKLLAEKKRRARINNCLMQIRDIVCDGEQEKETDLDKMEKAEILEKTLEVLTKLRQDFRTPTTSNPLATRKAMAVRYASGFSSCAEESIRYIQNSHLVPVEVKQHLQGHLRAIAKRVERVVETDDNIVSKNQASSSTNPSSPSSSSNTIENIDNESVIVVDSGVSEQIPGYYIPSPILTSTPKPHSVHPQSNPTPQFPHKPEYEYIPPQSFSASSTESKDILIYPAQECGRHVSGSNPSSPSYKKDGAPSSALAFSSLMPVSIPLSSHRIDPSSMSTSLSASTPVTATVLPIHFTAAIPGPFYPDQPAVYTYHGYEPYTTSTASSVPLQPVPETPKGVSTCYSSRRSPAPETSHAAPPVTPNNALDLCVKRIEVHNISPETMWRPW